MRCPAVTWLTVHRERQFRRWLELAGRPGPDGQCVNHDAFDGANLRAPSSSIPIKTLQGTNIVHGRKNNPEVFKLVLSRVSCSRNRIRILGALRGFRR
eukprot:2690564-Pyramimonas_sp.AAC.1